jgi:hypothetical protein
MALAEPKADATIVVGQHFTIKNSTKSNPEKVKKI